MKSNFAKRSLTCFTLAKTKICWPLRELGVWNRVTFDRLADDFRSDTMLRRSPECKSIVSTRPQHSPGFGKSRIRIRQMQDAEVHYHCIEGFICKVEPLGVAGKKRDIRIASFGQTYHLGREVDPGGRSA